MTISSESHGTRLALLAVIALAAALRFWGIGSGIPYSIGVDEPQILNRALIMMRTGNFNPEFYDYPTLYIYVQLAVACVRFLTGAMLGEWTSLSQASLPDFVFWGRAVTALLGTLTVLVVYRIGLRFTARHALLAAGLMAVMPMHVRESHFILTDVPVTFFVALTCLMALRAAERPTISAFLVAGGIAGFAAATKYPGALALIMPLLAACIARDAKPWRGLAAAAAVGGAGLAFLIAAPYTLLDLPGFLNGYAKLMGSYTGAGAGEPGWSIYLKHLRRSAHWPAFIAIHAGLIVAVVRAVRGPGRMAWMLLLVFPLLYFFFVSRQSLVFGRYLLPIIPFVSLLAAGAVIAAAGMLPRIPMRRQLRAGVVALLTVAIALPPAADAVGFNLMIAKKSTAAQAYAWLQQHAKPGTVIAVEGTDLVLMYSEFHLVQMPQLRLQPLEHYVEQGVTYLVASSQCYGPYLSQPASFAEEYADYLSLFKRTQEVARFVPSDEHPGAELRILKVVP